MNLFGQIVSGLFALAWLGVVISLPFSAYYGAIFWHRSRAKLFSWPGVFFRSDLPAECEIYRKKTLKSGGVLLGFWLAGALFWVAIWLGGSAN